MTSFDDIRPVVATFKSIDKGAWVFGGVLLVGALVLFSVLSANRETAQTNAVAVPQNDPNGTGTGERIVAPPPLVLSEASPSPPVMLQRFPPPASLSNLPTANTRPIRQGIRSVQTLPRPAPAPLARPPMERQTRVPQSEAPAQLPEPPLAPPPTPQVVYQAPQLGTPSNSSAITEGGTERVTAARFANPALTVPQGTVIPAVLETALDSTRAGAVRALVQRDVYGFDGTRILIHRGSRLYGEYEADLVTGQNRALVRWTRLIRPDGVTVSLDSPASDPLGRAGIKGKVDGKFFQRFGNAILQSALDIGVGVAVREASDGVVVALPGSTQNIQPQRNRDVQPTLKVKHGTSVSVFVARDLDFSTVDS